MRPLQFKIISLAALLSLACTTRVSEWVLLNAVPHEYTLVYFHKNGVDEKAMLRNNKIVNEINSGNIKFRDVVKDDISQPYYGLYYGNRLVTRYDDPAQLKYLVTSPLREQISEELMKGKLCVLLLLKSGNSDKDIKGSAVIKKSVSASHFSDIIPVVELDRNDPSEKHLISMLLNVEDDLNDIREPMLFGIFGRFKALEPLVASGITEENLGYMIEFLTADCSCLIKDNLPGTDILCLNRWDSPSTALVNAILDANPSLIHR